MRITHQYTGDTCTGIEVTLAQNKANGIRTWMIKVQQHWMNNRNLGLRGDRGGQGVGPASTGAQGRQGEG